MSNPEEKAPEQQTPAQMEKPQAGKIEKAPHWITDMYDKMNIPVKALDAMLIVLGVLIVLLFVFGNQVQLGI